MSIWQSYDRKPLSVVARQLDDLDLPLVRGLPGMSAARTGDYLMRTAAGYELVQQFRFEDDYAPPPAP